MEDIVDFYPAPWKLVIENPSPESEDTTLYGSIPPPPSGLLRIPVGRNFNCMFQLHVIFTQILLLHGIKCSILPQHFYPAP